LLANLSLRAIRAYQHYISPHKGYSCAYRCATGRDGCSGYGYRVIERFGLHTGLALLRRRLHLCGETHRSRTPAVNPRLHYQQGHCDLPCDLDVGGCSGCPFDFGPGGKKSKNPEQSEQTLPRSPAMQKEDARRREREEIDLAYEHYLLKTDKGVVTLPRLVYGIGIVCSVTGFIGLSAGNPLVMLASGAIGFCGIGLIGWSYRLKRKAIGKSTARPSKVT
jgi:putative component of membrane protein insertase Oxa1/YidC/SpoIIIJ protein YidD